MSYVITSLSHRLPTLNWDSLQTLHHQSSVFWWKSYTLNYIVCKFSASILLLSNIHLMFIHLVAHIDLSFFLFLIYFILFFNFTILYWFSHISKWIHHRYTCVPHPEPSSLLPPHTIPLILFVVNISLCGFMYVLEKILIEIKLHDEI